MTLIVTLVTIDNRTNSQVNNTAT